MCWNTHRISFLYYQCAKEDISFRRVIVDDLKRGARNKENGRELGRSHRFKVHL
jgi:hypothetical protein